MRCGPLPGARRLRLARTVVVLLMAAALCARPLAARVAQTAALAIQVSPERAEVVFGEEFTILVERSCASDYELLPAAMPSWPGISLRLLQSTTALQAGQWVAREQYAARALALDAVELSALSCSAAPKVGRGPTISAKSDVQSLRVRSCLAHAGDLELELPEGPLPIAGGWKGWWIATLSLLTILAGVWWRWKPTQPKPLPLPRPLAPPKAAWESRIADWASRAEQASVDSSAWCADFVALLAEALHAPSATPGCTQTASELLSLWEVHVGPTYLSTLQGLLQSCDRVRYARAETTLGERSQLAAAAKNLFVAAAEIHARHQRGVPR